MNETTFWQIIEPLGWSKTANYKAIKKQLVKQLTAEQAEELHAVYAKLASKLSVRIEAHEEDSGENAGLGDDSFSDLVAHIVGLGQQEYEASFNNPRNAIARAHSGDFTESFAYCLPYKSDYEALHIEHYLGRAEEALAAYRTVAAASEDDIPWLPKLQGDLTRIISGLDAFLQSRNPQDLLGHEDALKRSAETVAKTLSRLSIGFFEQQPLALALNECRNKWVVWNLLTDLRDFVS